MDPADETQPLLASAASADSSPSSTLVDCSAAPSGTATPNGTGSGSGLLHGDPDHPHNWPDARRWGMTLLLAFMAYTVTFTCISIVPFASHIVKDLDAIHNRGDPGFGVGGGGGHRDADGVRAASVLLVTIWELGEAAGPLAIAPLAETAALGRGPVLAGAMLLFLVATVAAALARSTAVFITVRGLTGVAVATNVLGPAIVGDLFPPAQRGSAMALVQLAPLLGGAVGPAIGGAVADSWGWRSVLWISAGLAAICNLLLWFVFRETYLPAILYRKRRQQKTTASVAATSTSSESPLLPPTPPSSAGSGARHIRDAVLRPAVVMTDSFVLVLMALFGAVQFAHYYIMSTTLPGILESRYTLSSAATGAIFLVPSAGAFVAALICNRYIDRIYIYLTNTRGDLVRDAAGTRTPASINTHGTMAADEAPVDHPLVRAGRPEFRLPLTLAAAGLLPCAVALYGWAAEYRLSLPVLLSAVALEGATETMMLIPLGAYVVDAFGLYAASAMTAVIVTRCLSGTFLPLTVAPLVAAFGYGRGFTVLAVLTLALAPLPVFVFYRGAAWRQRSKYTRDA